MSSKFFIICQIGFEETLKSEIINSWPMLLELDTRFQAAPIPQLKIEKGGIELECPYHIGIQLNFFLKSATRVLVRVGEFRAKDFPTLFNKMSKIEIERYFKSTIADVSVTTHTSRINHKGRVKDTVLKALLKKKIKLEEEKSENYLFVRIENDYCVLSIDTSGEPLYKRGFATLKGTAPLRETIAYFMLNQMLSVSIPNDEVVSSQRKTTERNDKLSGVRLWDPMMGSGTILSEAVCYNTPNFFRKFAFQEFANCPKLFKSSTFSLNYKIKPQKLWGEILGSDKDEKVVSVSQKNMSSLLSEIKIYEPEDIYLQATDFFELDLIGQKNNETKLSTLSNYKLKTTDLIANTSKKTWIVSNLPFGERIKSFPLINFIKQCANLNISKVGILINSKHYNEKSITIGNYQVTKKVKLFVGGIATYFVILSRNQ